MKELELTLSLVIPSLAVLLPVTLPFLSLGDIVFSWISLVALLSTYSLTFLSLCVPQVTKSTTRLARFQSFFTKEQTFLLSANLLFSYFISGLVNIWSADDLQCNLALFWCTVTSQYHMVDCILHYRYQYTSSPFRVPWMTRVRLSGTRWVANSAAEVFKMIRFVLPVYVLFYADITIASGYICRGVPSADELSYYFLLRPTTILNIGISSLLTHIILTLGYQATLHVAAKSGIPKVKGKISTERCVEALKSTDPRMKYSALSSLSLATRSSLSTRLEILALHDGHPVLWHGIHKELTSALSTFNTAMAESATSVAENPSGGRSPSKQAGRALKSDPKPAQLYSVPEVKSDLVEGSEKPPLRVRVTGAVSGWATERWGETKTRSTEGFLNSKIGKFLLTEVQERTTENKIASLPLLLDLCDTVGLLCCRAKEEDRYGVVQLSLPEILDTLTATLKTIEQIPIATTNASHATLKRALQAFIYQLTQTYGASLLNLSLSTDSATLVQQYISV